MTQRKQPYIIDEQPGEKWWCACGHSQNQPYCDGSHARLNTGISPVKVVIDKPAKIAWCGCKQSGNKPYCDGTHNKL